MNFMALEQDEDANPLSLQVIRRTLIRLEETIIFSLIERAQFALNAKMYTSDGFASVLHQNGFKGSWLEWFLFETEKSHALVRRYDSPDEHPFTARNLLPSPILPPLNYPTLLYPNDVNFNAQILDFYIKEAVPAITRTVTEAYKLRTGRIGDDGNYGSAATRDIECLQAISRRIHCGMFVSESKFLSEPAAFIPHILNPNSAALEALITKPAVEAALLIRLEKKARWYGQELGPAGEVVDIDTGATKLDVKEVVRLYREYIIPLTKDVEVEYLLHRLDGLSSDEIEALRR